MSKLLYLVTRTDNGQVSDLVAGMQFVFTVVVDNRIIMSATSTTLSKTVERANKVLNTDIPYQNVYKGINRPVDNNGSGCVDFYETKTAFSTIRFERTVMNLLDIAGG